MNRNLLIIGADKYRNTAKEIAEEMNYFNRIDFLDDDSESCGSFSEYKKLYTDYSYAFAAFEDSKLRLDWIKKLEESFYKIAVLTSLSAHVSSSSQIGKGTLIAPMAVINTDSVISDGCIVSSGAVINSCCFIGDGCHIGCNSVVAEKSIITTGTILPHGTFFQGSAFDSGRLIDGTKTEVNINV